MQDNNKKHSLGDIRRARTSRNTSRHRREKLSVERGFALPMVLISTITMIIVMLSAVTAGVSINSAINGQYYTSVANEAAESGVVMAQACLQQTGTAQWTNAKPLKPNTDCAGNETTSCSGTAAPACFVLSSRDTRSSFEVGVTTNADGVVISLDSKGLAQRIRTSNGAVWATFSGFAKAAISGNGGVVTTCPAGFIVVPGSSTYGTSDFCTMKYEAKRVGSTNVPISQAAGTPWVYISQTDAIANSPNVAGCTGCHLISEAEYLTIAQNVLSVDSNWSGGSVGSGYICSGHDDNAPSSALAASSNDSDGYSGTGNTSPSNQRRTLTLTNGEVIWDMAGNVWDWTSGTATGGQPGASGFAWRQWNATAGTGSLSPNPHPSYGTPAASGWTSAQGIGMIYSDSADADLRGFRRGGDWGSGGNAAGVLTLSLLSVPGATAAPFGFRVSQ